TRQRCDQAREAAGGDDVGSLAVGPLGLDAAHQAIHRVRRAEQHARADRLVGAPSDGARRGGEVGGGQLGGAPDERVRCRTDPGMITPPKKCPSAVMQSNVVAVPKSTTMVSRWN